MQILIIEDEPLIQKVLKILLEKRGHSVEVTSQGKKGLELLLRRDFDRVICDLMLQDITGFDIIEEAKKKYSPEALVKHFVIMTAYTSDTILERANTYGCIVLNKPFENVNNALDLIIGSE